MNQEKKDWKEDIGEGLGCIFLAIAMILLLNAQQIINSLFK